MPHRLAQHNSHHMTIFEGPGQARLCLQCRNQAENFPCPVKVEEDDEQPQENYRLTPHTSPHPRTSPWSAIRYLCERLRDINAGCIMNFISLQSVLLYILQNMIKIQKKLNFYWAASACNFYIILRTNGVDPDSWSNDWLWRRYRYNMINVKHWAGLCRALCVMELLDRNCHVRGLRSAPSSVPRQSNSAGRDFYSLV